MAADDKTELCRKIGRDIDALISKRCGGGLGYENLIEKEAEMNSTNDREKRNYEYLDHTADIQLHSWGESLAIALENLVLAMFGCMTDLDRVEYNPEDSARYASEVVAQGYDIYSMIFSFLHEWLFVLCESHFMAREVKVSACDTSNFQVISSAKGERMNTAKHSQEMEIKAITYSNMQVKVEGDKSYHIWVIVDI